jgi:hypothetical protein
MATPGGSCSARASASTEVPATSFRSMRVSSPRRSSRHCAKTDVHHADHLARACAGQGADDRQFDSRVPARTRNSPPTRTLNRSSAAGDRNTPSPMIAKRGASSAAHRHQRLRQGRRAEDVEADDRQQGRARASTPSTGTSSSSTGLASSTAG